MFNRSSLLVCKLTPIHGGQERPKKETDLSRLVGGQSNKEENLHIRLVFGSCKTNTSLHRPSRILRVYIEAFNGLSHITVQMFSITHCPPKGASLKMAATVGMVGRTYLPRPGKGVRSLQLPGSTGGHVLLMTSSNTIPFISPLHCTCTLITHQMNLCHSVGYPIMCCLNQRLIYRQFILESYSRK